MKLQVLLFAAAADAVGQSSVTVDVGEPATVGDLRQQLTDQYPALKNTAAVLLVAVNSEYVADGCVLSEGDEVACFPPVSGG